MQFELRHLRYFLAVADELSFTRAAERLHVAQPALSAQIRQLERQLGCELFVRTTRKVELSSHGELLLDDAREIVRLADEAAAKLAAAARGERGVLRIGFVGHGGGETGTEILRKFAAEFPSIEPDLIEAPTLEETQRQVRDDETDVAFVWLPLLYPELSSTLIQTEQKLLAIHEENMLAKKPELSAVDLYEQQIVAPWEHMPPAMLEFWLGRSVRMGGCARIRTPRGSTSARRLSPVASPATVSPSRSSASTCAPASSFVRSPASPRRRFISPGAGRAGIARCPGSSTSPAR